MLRQHFSTLYLNRTSMSARLLVCLGILTAFALSSCGMMEDYAAAQQFADEAIHAIVTDWDQEALASRFAEPVLEDLTDEDLAALFEMYRQVFGKALNIEAAVGRINTQARVGTDGKGTATIGVFTAPVEFDLRHGEAIVTIQKFETGWFVTDFRIRGKSPSKTDSTSTGKSIKAVEV